MLDFALKVEPNPQGLSRRLDLENNFYHQGWFNGEVLHLSIEATCRLNLGAFNPFDFLLESNKKYDQAFLNPYLAVAVDFRDDHRKWIKKFRSNLI